MPWESAGHPSATAIGSAIAGEVVATAFQTTTPLGDGATYTGSILDCRGYSQLRTVVLADRDGTIRAEYYADAAGTDLIRTLTVPYTAANGYQLYAAPIFSDYVRYYFDNSAGAAQTDFFYETQFLRTAIQPQIARLDAPIVGGMMATVHRSIITGQDGSANFQNVTVVETSNDDGTYYNLQTVSGARPSELTGRTPVSITLDGITANTLLLTNTAGKTVYITDVCLTIENSSAGTPGSAKLRDGTTVAGAVVLPIRVEEAPGSGTSLTTITTSFLEPIAFATGVFLEEAAGTLTVGGIIQGYQE